MIFKMLLDIPSGKHTKNHGKSPFFMGKSTISMAFFNSYVSHYQRVYPIHNPLNHYKAPLNSNTSQFFMGKSTINGHVQ